MIVTAMVAEIAMLETGRTVTETIATGTTDLDAALSPPVGMKGQGHRLATAGIMRIGRALVTSMIAETIGGARTGSATHQAGPTVRQVGRVKFWNLRCLGSKKDHSSSSWHRPST
jgi:hypothetical protein